jgi:hypothetical protein
MSLLEIAPRVEPYLGGMGAVMLAAEEDAGRKTIWPHHKRRPKWFEASDWRQWPVLSYDNRELHIVAIHSARQGALRRLLDGAAKAGLTPVIVEPIGHIMPALVRKWGWQMTISGEGWDRREEWRPAPVGRNPKGEDAQRLRAQHELAVGGDSRRGAQPSSDTSKGPHHG